MKLIISTSEQEEYEDVMQHLTIHRYFYIGNTTYNILNRKQSGYGPNRIIEVELKQCGGKLA